MKTDFEGAERNLEKAVELTEGRVAVNQHTLGQVRRLWIEQKLGAMFRAEKPTPRAILEEAESLFDSAMGAFSRSRDLNPDGEHAYVTPIQMILYIADFMRRAGNAKTVAEMAEGESRAATWLRENMMEAEGLYRQVDEIRGQTTPSRYLLDVRRRLSGAFGEYDALIHAWEGLMLNRGETPELRRALSAAYLGRQDRVWSRVSQRDLRRIADMMDANLRAHPSGDRDVRMWFDAYRRLPEFNLITALERVGAWAARSDELAAHFYCYLIHFMLRRVGLESDHDRMMFHMRRTRDLAAGRALRQYAYEWLAAEPAWFPFANHREMGAWDPAANFFGSPESLARPTGVIETIESPQAGRIRMQDGSTAFFTPGPQFRKSQHVGALVSFYLGFSYEGLRAWRHELATPAEAAPVSSPERDLEAPAPADAPEPPTQRQAVDRRAPTRLNPEDAALREEIARVVIAHLRERGGHVPVRVKNLTPVLMAHFPGPPVYSRLGYVSTKDMLDGLEGVVVDASGEVWVDSES
jgi:hypothetical protein